MQIIKQKIDEISNELGKKIYPVNKIYKCTKINYKRLVIDSVENVTCIIDLNQKYDFDNKITSVIIITDEDFVIVGFNCEKCDNCDNCENCDDILYATDINKFPTCIFYGHIEEFGYNYDTKIILSTCSYKMFELIIQSFDCPQILTSRENSHILSVADKLGLVTPIICVASDIMNSYFDKKKSIEMTRLYDFINGKYHNFFCYTSESYFAYKNIFTDDPSIIPIQFIYNRGNIYHISVYSGIPVGYYDSQSYFDDIQLKLDFNLTVDINQKRHKMIYNTDHDTDSIILGLTPVMDKPNNRYEKLVEHMQPVLDKDYCDPDYTYNISNKILETRYNPKLLYNSNDIEYCKEILRVLYMDMNNEYNYQYVKNIIPIDKFINMDNCRKMPYPHHISENGVNMPQIIKLLKDIIKNHLYEELFKKQPFIDLNIDFDVDNKLSYLKLYAGFMRI